MNNFLKIILILFVFCSCSNKSENEMIGVKHFYVNSFTSTYELKGVSLPIEILGLNNIAIVDTFLLGIDCLGRDNFIHVYSANDFKSLGSIISKGRGPNELLALSYRGQWEKDSLGCHIWIDDNAIFNKSFKLNITKSLESKETIFDNKIIFNDYPASLRYFVSDSTFIGIDFNNSKNFKVLEYDINSNKSSNLTTLFKRNFLSIDEKRVYGFKSDFNDKNKRIAIASYYLDEISIMSSDFSDIINCKVGKSVVRAIDVLKIENNKRKIKYNDVKVTDNFVFALYVNKSFDDIQNIENKTGVEVHIFNWTGEAIAKVKIKENISFISIDNNNKCVYANTANEQVYKYDFSEIIL